MPSVHPSVSGSHRASFWLAALVLAAGTYWLGFHTRQDQFGGIVLGYLPCFLAYFWVVYRWQDATVPIWGWLGLGLGLRLLLLQAFPAHSDDVYRFLWDGRLMVQGISPFEQLPEWYMQPDRAVPGLDGELFSQLNSPRYFTVYPPLAQATFALAAWVAPDNLMGSVRVLKGFLLLADLIGLAALLGLLRHWSLPKGRALIYWLNPLVVVEGLGNLHYEGAMVSFVLAGLWLLVRRRWFSAGVAFALGIATKLIPLLFLPLLLRRLGWRRLLGFAFGLSATLALLAYPLLSGFWLGNYGESLDLYFRKFEFNGSVYYLLRWIGYQRVGYNLIARIGPVLAGLTALFICAGALLERRPTWRSLPRSMLLAVLVYLALATTVHPWYIITPVALCLFTPYRFPLLWSALAVGTYVNYRYDPYWENLWVVGLEYGLVLAFGLWELYRRLPEWPGQTGRASGLEG